MGHLKRRIEKNSNSKYKGSRIPIHDITSGGSWTPFEISEVELQQGPGLYVLTNPMRSYGAAVIMDLEVLEMVGERLQNDYFVLPSSVHEGATRFAA